jgi:16S rRNA (cytosine1402-N4)-methyltransferase
MPTVADMRAARDATPGGATDEPAHRPVLLHPLIESLQPRPGSVVVDATLGGGGVTAAIIDLVRPGGHVVAIDRDREAVEAARARFASAGEDITVVQGNFTELEQIVGTRGIPSVDAVAFDLGVSSLQLDDPERGFSFRENGPLDMRMDRDHGPTASDVVNGEPVEELESILRDLGQERFARAIAQGIARARRRAPITTTGQLRAIVEDAMPRRFWPKRIHPATRTFQAIRIAVNDELLSLERGLQAAIRILRPGGRLGVISFHSLEDTIVKNTLHVAAQNCICPPQQPNCTCTHRATLFILTRKVIRPDARELADNPRSRSARLRVAEKLHAGG